MAIRPLSKELQKIAEEELNEEPNRIQEYLEHLRTWLKQQPHLTTRQDDYHLLYILRVCKFSLQKAKLKLDHFHTAKSLFVEYFTDRDPFSPDIQRALKAGIILPLDNASNRTAPRVIIVRWSVGDPTDIPYSLIIKLFSMIVDIMLEEDDTAVTVGIQILIDYKNFAPGYILQFGHSTIYRNGIRLDSAYPLRIKGMDFMNIPSFFDTIFNLLKPVLSKKLTERTHAYTADQISNIYKCVPQDILPKECGGNKISADELRDTWKKKVESYSEWFKENEKYGCDENLRPNKTATETFGVEGTFRKLNID